MGEEMSICVDDKKEDEPSNLIYYAEGGFVVPRALSFEKKSTFTQVEQASKVFCQRNEISLFYVPLLTRIIAYNHSQAFNKIWKTLDVEERNQFLQDLNKIEHDLMDSMFYFFLIDRPTEQFQLELKMQKPRMMQADSDSRQMELRRKGESIIKQNKLAVVFMCAGPSRRYNRTSHEQRLLTPLNCFRTFKARFTMLDLMMLRLRRNLNGVRVPIVISCNQENYQPISKHITEMKYYGLGIENFNFYINVTLTVFNKKGEYQLGPDKRLIKRSIGSAYCAQYIVSAQMREDLEKKGTEWVLFSGTQNLFQNPCDPVFLGLMAESGKLAGSKCTSINFGQELLPRYYHNPDTVSLGFLSAGQMVKSDLTRLSKMPVAMNSLVFQMQQLKRVVRDYESSARLGQKYQMILGEQTVFDFDLNAPQVKSCYSFEKDLRYYLTCSKDPLLYLVHRKADYVPIITKNNQYSLLDALQYFEERVQTQYSQLTTHK